MAKPLLSVTDLDVSFAGRSGEVRPVLRGVGFDLGAGETLGIVGESGSGKTLLGLSLIGLLPQGASAAGSIRYAGADLLSKTERALCETRGREIGFIFQEPLTALNPAMTVGDQIAEGLVWHRGLSWREARGEAVRLLDRVGLPDARRRAGAYPHEFSGGQRQRVGIAIAIALKPRILIADEPTTALDVTVQAGVLDLIDDLVREEQMALILVSHDLGVIARSCSRTIVLYAGRIMEEGATEHVMTRPRHPYTEGLLRAIPRRVATGRLPTIPGLVPAFDRLPPGCVFGDRCPKVVAACRAREPDWFVEMPEAGEPRGVRCIRPIGGPDR